MAKAYKCDRCGKLFESYKKNSNSLHIIRTLYMSGEYLDLCPKCNAELQEWVTCEGRMKYVQETVNTIMNTCRTNSIKDKCFRNAARFIQNAIDGSSPEFELINDEQEWIANDKEQVACNCTDEEITKSFIEDVEAVKDLLPNAESEE